ncbi:MAG TPA: ATP-binding protein [Leptolyngbyaceae cyanobacterium]
MNPPTLSPLSRLNPQRHLGTRLALTAAGTVLLLSIVISVLVGYLSGAQLKQAAQQSLAELAFQMADKLDRGMFERYQDVQILTQLDPIRNPATSIEEQQAMLERLQQSHPDYAWIGLASREGRVVASTRGLLVGANVKERPWFQNAQAAPFVGDVHEALLLADLLPHDEGETLRFVDISTPVIDTRGNFIGVLGAHLSWSWAKDVQRSLLAPMEAHRRVEIFILDGEGDVLLGADDETVMLPAASVETSGSREYVAGLAHTQGYRDYPGLDWQVLVQQPAAIALAPARSLQWHVLGVGLLLGLITALWHSLRSHQIVNPILRLIAAADAICQGHQDVTIPTSRRQDEIATLAASLRNLVETTRQQQAHLTKANQQLKADIERQQRDAATIQEQAALLNIATDAIIVRDLDWNIRFWNTGAERIYGWSAQEACNQNAYALLNRVRTPELDEAGQVVLAQDTWQGVLKKLTKSGQERFVSSRWDLVRDDEGRPKAILSVDTDITEKKQLEEQLLRTQRLESLGTLAGGIAHDLNNIFAPILMGAELLLLKLPNLSERDRQLVATLDASARRGSGLVRQILSFVRGLAGECTLIQLEHVLSEVRQICQSTFPKSIDIELRVNSQVLWMVNADANQLHQVFMNLCVNARDAMPEGGKLSLKAENLVLTEVDLLRCPDALPGNFVQVTVQDTGSGIPPEALEHIFEPFFTTKEIGKGTGLGLSTTLGIVRRHGGFIDIETKVALGTRFSLYFPAVLITDETVNEPSERLINGHNELILVVDDESRILETAKQSLEAYGYRVMTASSGFEAIERYSKYQDDIQLVLTDMQMPDMNGESMVKVLRILNPAVKVIAASGSQDTIPEVLAIQAFLPKPYTLNALLNAIAQVIQN